MKQKSSDMQKKREIKKGICKQEKPARIFDIHALLYYMASPNKKTNNVHFFFWFCLFKFFQAFV